MNREVIVVTGSCGYSWESSLEKLVANLLKAGARRVIIVGEPHVARRIGKPISKYEHAEMHIVNPSKYPENLLKIYSTYQFELLVFAFRANTCYRGVITGFNCKECEGLYIKPSDILLRTAPSTPVVTVYKGYPEVGSRLPRDENNSCVCEDTRSLIVERVGGMIDLSRNYSVSALRRILKSLDA